MFYNPCLYEALGNDKKLPGGRIFVGQTEHTLPGLENNKLGGGAYCF